ncbi:MULTISPECIES: LexA family protein [Pseudomonas]|jgi:SOS-response transcriptional repressor LexA|uniref:Transcriptional repressor, CI/C2 family n=1 Tax=Pseudomonas putida (strain ATCC 47054 / DSM 6125 / CFBP 8728 / NCIMB 11950 / KT2440) TaxID=160488 RepID=Q88IG6_PSEPK|nr:MULTISPECIES: S24 family peptidase [Pseudomonas]AAN68641.1 putative transcriptional repressor, CI/C2 family [Pseudomonas putida KT2440]KMU97698.1 peptidase S24 [Pseudomonas putida]KMY35287.1 peptidase S24 [Pseudomonas putida]MDD2080920.1 S24 family peptidase [Pseudomonas putida]PXZ53336.1 peptidase S24 [Pseudomonas sp. SMT-1]
MVDKNELRAAFSARLHEALDDAGVRSRGRGVDVHKRLKMVGVHKTTQAISKWLNGEAIAEADSMAALCAWLNVRREWLEYGVLPKAQEPNSKVHQLQVGDQSNVSGILERFGKVPLISWVQAGAWCEAISNFEPYQADSWLSCPVPISDSGYALKVLGDSMTNPGPGRSYPTGCIIFVDPEVEANTGDRVIARVPRTNEVTFKVLVSDAGRQFLRPINPQYPIIDITEETHICGKVVGSFIPE